MVGQGYNKETLVKNKGTIQLSYQDIHLAGCSGCRRNETFIPQLLCKSPALLWRGYHVKDQRRHVTHHDTLITSLYHHHHCKQHYRHHPISNPGQIIRNFNKENCKLSVKSLTVHRCWQSCWLTSPITRVCCQ